MNRDAMVIYLRDVRDLEVARYRLQQLDEESERELQAKLAELERLGRHKEESEEPAIAGFMRLGVGITICCGVVAVLVLAIFPLVAALMFVFAAIGLLSTLAGLPTYLRERKQYQEGLTIVRAINRVAEVNAPAREQAERLARQNQLQLKLLERTERNTAEAARYAELAACNTRTDAIFAAAGYFSD